MHDLKTGTTIGGIFRVMEFLGEGGMGVVYKVEHIHLSKIFALKILKLEHLSESVMKRFRLEAQSIARLDHPNIIKNYDMSQTEDGRPYYTMDFLEGQSLDDYLKDYDLEIEDALPIFRQVCAALAYAHDRGILHRDIKPGNIMLIGNEQTAPGSRPVKIVDFGIAKLIDNSNDSLQGLTRPGEVFGSPLYMSPEQCLGEKLTPAADMYSVGVTFFQALTGRPPLLGKSAIETIAMHQTTMPPKLSEIAGKPFPPALEKIVARLLAKSPDNRFDSLADVADELRRLERGERGTQSGTGYVPPRGGQRGLYEQARNLDSDNSDDDDEDNDYDDESDQTGEHVLFRDRDRDRDRNRENDTAQISTGNKVLPIVGVVALLAASALIFGVAFQIIGKPKQQTKSAVVVAETKTQDLKLENGPSSLAKSLDPETRQKVETYLKTNQTKYFKSLDENGDKVYIFPSDFPLGDMVGLRQIRRQLTEAQGVVTVPAIEGITLSASPVIAEYPELLKKFRPVDLYGLTIKDGKPSKELIANIKELSGLHELNITSMPLRKSDLSLVNSLPQATSLILADCKLNGDDLAQYDLKRFYSLDVSGASNLSPLLAVLTKCPKLTRLYLSGSKLSSADLDAIVRMEKLEELFVKDCGLTDETLPKLTKLQHIERIDLQGCEALTEKSLETICQFKHIRIIGLPLSLNTEKNAQYLQTRLPHLKDVQPLMVVPDTADLIHESDKDSRQTTLNQRVDKHDGRLETAFLADAHMFSHVFKENGQRLRRFRFPEFSLGDFKYNDKIKPAVETQAQGEVLVPENSLRKLNASEHLRSYPQLLAYFEPTDLWALTISDVSSNVDIMVKNVSKLVNLCELDLSGCDVEDRHLASLEAIKSLKILHLGNTKVTPIALSRSKLLKTVYNLDVEGMQHLEPLLLALAKGNSLTKIGLNSTTLSPGELKAVAAIPNLLEIHMQQSSITSDDLKYLTGMPHLEYLNLQNCVHLDEGAMNYLLKIKNLNKLKLPRGVLSIEAYEKLRKTRPALYIKEAKD